MVKLSYLWAHLLWGLLQYYIWCSTSSFFGKPYEPWKASNNKRNQVKLWLFYAYNWLFWVRSAYRYTWSCSCVWVNNYRYRLLVFFCVSPIIFEQSWSESDGSVNPMFDFCVWFHRSVGSYFGFLFFSLKFVTCKIYSLAISSLSFLSETVSISILLVSSIL